VKSYDVVVVGSGTGGQTAAHNLSQYGVSVAVVENSSTPGGVCALAGCQAKKWYYEASETMARARDLSGKGVVAPPEMDWKTVRDQKRAFTGAVPDSTRKGLDAAGIDFIAGTAAFRDPETLTVDGQPLKSKFIVLATGARPAPLPFEGAQYLVSSSQFLELDGLPPRIAFVGGGFISFEFAHFAARLGPARQIHILEAGPRPLGPFDGEMAAHLMDASRAEGIDIHTDTEITGIERNNQGYVVKTPGKEDLYADMVVHGAGRAPAITNLELEKGSVDFTRRGIVVDEKMRTANARVFAAGDCADTVQLARVADYEACVAAKNILAELRGGQEAVMDYRAVPSVLFTLPQYAMVGATEEALQSEGIRYSRAMATNLSWPTYRRTGMKHAAYKVLVDHNNRIAGAHIISDNAAGLINIFKQAMIHHQDAGQLYWEHVMTPYPTRESDITYMLKPFVKHDPLAGL
jgi:glutathione reductase (NADPH)